METMDWLDRWALAAHHNETEGKITPEGSMAELRTEDMSESDDQASHISYSIVTSLVNRKVNGVDEREAVRELIRQTALELHVKLQLVLQDRFKLEFEVNASNTGRRREPLMDVEG